ncbi:hypothetical protein AAFF_G00399050 [Aldrovandia affinis]|uniref:Peptidase A2 domain-containing protein n=1 Tax=Aldrovandia affinis TaxID=143900 RepID=A0AAD7WKC4_9TELE|nr:hypothetical protein AAFF_G00399050 [Aldrovandia affinis]
MAPEEARQCCPPYSFGRPGNAGGRPSVTTVSASDAGSLLFITDTLSGWWFLCDTGAQVSVLPASHVNIQTGSHGPPLEATNASMIQTYGKRRVVLCFHGRQFTWDFTMAKVAKPLLGADFFCTNELLVDVKNHRLVNAEDFGSFPCTLSSLLMTTLSCALTASSEFFHLLGRFPDLTRPTFSTADTKHGVEHHIPTTGSLVHARTRRFDLWLNSPNSKAEFANMERIQRLNSPTWNALA